MKNLMIVLLVFFVLSGCQELYSPKQQDPYGGYQDSGSDAQKRADELRRGRDTRSSVGGSGFRVSVSSGAMNFNGQNLPFIPMSFQINDGERKTIIFRSLSGSKKSYQTVPVDVEYRQGALTLDNGGIRLSYESSWDTQRNYSNLSGGHYSGISIVITKER